MTTARFIVLGVLAVLIGCSATALHEQAAFDAERQSEPPHTKPGPAPGMPGLPLEVNAAEVGAWLHGLEEAEWIAGVERGEREAAEEAERMAAARRVAVQPVVRSGVSGTVGECTGFAVPDYIIQRESGGNPSAYNPSGAYGCAQTLLSHYSNGACQGLDPYTIEGQRECVWILSNGGTNLRPWAG